MLLQQVWNWVALASKVVATSCSTPPLPPPSQSEEILIFFGQKMPPPPKKKKYARTPMKAADPEAAPEIFRVFFKSC